MFLKSAPLTLRKQSRNALTRPDAPAVAQDHPLGLPPARLLDRCGRGPN